MRLGSLPEEEIAGGKIVLISLEARFFNSLAFRTLSSYFAHKVTFVRLSGDKELKPVSFRVREAAEGMLTVIMEHLVCYHCPVMASCMTSL